MSAALGRIVGALPGGGELREGQLEMAEAVAAGIRSRRHLVVQAQTGTGKSLAYLVPALLSGSRVVVATATKALQDQLVNKDLPLVAERLGMPVEYAVLKGRSNYLCRQRAIEVAGGGDQLTLTSTGPDSDAGLLGPLGREIRRLIEWAVTTQTGDMAELPFEPTRAAWSQLTVGSDECPGANRCPAGDVCFAEAARRRAAVADVVIVNIHLYGAHLAAGAAVLPDHDVIIFDEAHEVEDIMSDSFGRVLNERRLVGLARSARALVADRSITEALEESGNRLHEVLGPLSGTRVIQPLDPALSGCLALARDRLARLSSAVRSSDGEGPRKARVQQGTTHLLNDIDALISLGDGHVAWVHGPPHSPVLELAPLDVGAILQANLWGAEDHPTAVLTSATIPAGLSARLGMDPDTVDNLDAASPFDYPAQGLLYCATHLPDPRSPAYESAMHDELVSLINAAGGRTMALFTSLRAMKTAADAVRSRIPWTVLTQNELPKPLLVSRFSEEETSCLFATMGFWQGVDIPGPTLSLVTIDRLPFPRPDDPLLQARRQRVGAAAFSQIDLPRTASLLAQGVGRLIRSTSDRGVVAVLDPRLASARYRWDLIRALPPMSRTKELSEVEAFLAPLRVASPSSKTG